MLIRLGKFIIVFIIMCIIAFLIYWGLQSIFNSNTYDGTFVFNEKAGAYYGYLY